MFNCPYAEVAMCKIKVNGYLEGGDVGIMAIV